MSNQRMRPMAERMASLPKWARDLIASQERRNNELEASLATHRGEKSRVRVDPRGSDSKPEYYARDEAQVSFLLGDDWQDFLDVKIQKRLDGSRELCIRGGHCIAVRPESGNVVTITVEN